MAAAIAVVELRRRCTPGARGQASGGFGAWACPIAATTHGRDDQRSATRSRASPGSPPVSNSYTAIRFSDSPAEELGGFWRLFPHSRVGKEVDIHTAEMRPFAMILTRLAGRRRRPDRAGAARASAAPTFRAAVDRVTVAATVRDQRGRPVTTLKAEDFHLLDNGQPQRDSRLRSATPRR